MYIVGLSPGRGPGSGGQNSSSSSSGSVSAGLSSMLVVDMLSQRPVGGAHFRTILA